MADDRVAVVASLPADRGQFPRALRTFVNFSAELSESWFYFPQFDKVRIVVVNTDLFVLFLSLKKIR